MNYCKKTLSLVLAVVLVLLAGCNIGDTTWVYQTSETRMPAGLYITYQIDSLSLMATKMQEEHAADTEYVAPTTFAGLYKEQIEGMSGLDWVNQEAKKNARAYFAVEAESVRLGLSIDEQQLAGIKASVSESWPSAGITYEKNGISKDSYTLFQENMYKKDLLFTALYDEGGEQEVSAEEIKAVLKEQYAKSDILQLVKATADSEDGKTVEEQNKELKAMAESFVTRLAAGETAEALMHEYVLSTTAEDQKSTVEAPTEGSLTLVVSEEMKDYYMDNLVETILAAAEGKAVIHETENTIYVLNVRDVLEDDLAYESYRSMILSNLKVDEYEAYLEAVANGLSIAENQAALNRYTPKKLKEQ